MKIRRAGNVPMPSASAAVLCVVFLCAAVLPAPAQTGVSGGGAVAEKYLLWAEEAVAAGDWSRARTALERAADFADVSSDIPYLTALVYSKGNESRPVVLAALRQAIDTGRWLHYNESNARLLEAAELIALRQYAAALESLAVYRETATAADDITSVMLRLDALKGLAGGAGDSGGNGNRNESADSGNGGGFDGGNLGNNGGNGDIGIGCSDGDNGGFNNNPPPVLSPIAAEIHTLALEALNRYPRDSRPLRFIFTYAAGRNAGETAAIVEPALRRLNFLLETDPDLAWMAAPFIADTAAARRLVSAYRSGSFHPAVNAGFRPAHESIVQALRLELIDTAAAVEELFTPPAQGEHLLDLAIIEAVFAMLELDNDESKNLFAERLHSFTGAITEDEDNDGIRENRAVYAEGIPLEYSADTDQDRLNDTILLFFSGVPRWARLPGEAMILWEQFPFVHRAVLEEESFFPIPGAFRFTPVQFTELGPSPAYAGLLFPRRDPENQTVDRRGLVSASASVLRPSAEFPDGLERIYLERGIPIRAEEELNGALVTVTTYENGRPVSQQADLDLDGRMETLRRFRPLPVTNPAVPSAAESDLDGDGVFESARLYRPNGSVVYKWDMDTDGVYEYSETR